MTLLAGAFFFLPRVTVESSGPYDPLHPSPITFTISNINIVPLRNVQVIVGLCYVDPPEEQRGIRFRTKGSGNGDPPNECNGPAGVRFALPNWRVRWLDTDEKFQVALEDWMREEANSPKQIERANITIAAEYTPWWMPPFWRNTKEFRFITKKLSDGRIYWTPIPLNR